MISLQPKRQVLFDGQRIDLRNAIRTRLRLLAKAGQLRLDVRHARGAFGGGRLAAQCQLPGAGGGLGGIVAGLLQNAPRHRRALFVHKMIVQECQRLRGHGGYIALAAGQGGVGKVKRGHQRQ